MENQPTPEPISTGAWNSNLNPTRAALSEPRQPGRFTIERLHAKGGLGQVSLAHDCQLNRSVALKEIRPDRRDADARRRFVVEAEITGQLEHPGIVPIYALEKDANGEPYYAMRFIQGRPFSEAIQAYHREPTLLAFRELLQRFVSVCQTVAYAHSRDVIHRDLKPVNVMLGEYGETLVVDWGLAKRVVSGQRSVISGEENAALSSGDAQRSADATQTETIPVPSDATQVGQPLGTPVYMAPEQAAGCWNAVGPCSDIYSLGATLYELLTGQHAVRDRDVLDVLQKTQAGDFPPPRKVKADVPKPLDAICTKAMALKTDDRYGTAQELATDVEHWLADEPVAAWREPWSAGIRRWARRHRATVAGLAAAVSALMLGLAVGLAVVLALNRELDDRNTKLDHRLKQVKKGSALLGAIFENLNPRQGEIGRLDLAERLKQNVLKAVADLEEESVDDAETVADLQNSLGASLIELGEAPKAIPLLIKSRATRADKLGPGDPATLISLGNLAAAYQCAGELNVALPLLEQALAQFKAQLGPDHADTLSTMNNLAEAYGSAGRHDEAIALSEETVARRKATFGATHPETLMSRNNLARKYQAAGQLDKALLHFEQTLALRKETLGLDHPDTIDSLNDLGTAYRVVGQTAQAVPLLEQALAKNTELRGPDHGGTLTAMVNLGVAYQAVGQTDKALALLEQALVKYSEKLGRDNPQTLTTMNNLAWTYLSVRKYDRAIPLCEEALRRRTRILGPDHVDTLESQAWLAVSYRDTGRLPEGIILMADAMERAQRRPGPFPNRLAGIPGDLAVMYDRAGQFAKSEKLYSGFSDQAHRQFGPDDPRTAGPMAQLGLNLLKQSKWTDAEPILRECLTIREKKQPDEWTTFNTKSMLGGALLGQKKYADAEPVVIQGYEGMKEREAKIPPLSKVRLTEAVERLVHLYEETGKPDEAAKWRKVLDAAQSPVPTLDKNRQKP